jgi:hypothetical protein
MTAIARRLDPCLNWFRVLSKTQGRILWIFPAALLAGYLLAVTREGNPADGFLYRFSQNRVNAPLLREARGLNLSYARAAADPAAAAGKPVVWCVNGETADAGFVDSRQTQLASWTPPSDELKMGRGSNGYCWNVLAVVQGVERGVVKLRIVERL